jgi:uncharacterized protein (DUF362 family)
VSSGDEPFDGPPPLTRRHVLAGAAGAAAVTGGWFGWRVLRQPSTRVLRMSCPTYDDDLVRRVREGIRAFPKVLATAKGARVVLKPNLVEVHPGRPINTDPRLIAAAAAAFLEEGAREVIVAEGPGHMRDTEAILELTGLDDVLRPLKVPFVDLNTDDAVYAPLAANMTGLGKLPIAKTIMTADLVVSMPKMKTHHWAGATLSMKNLFGTVPGAIFGWPKNPLHWAGIPNSIADLWETIAPGFAIVDGIVGMEGDGPIMGTAVPHGVLLFGEQCPAVDAVAARLMGLKAERIGYLTRAVKLGGTMSPLRIEHAGDAVEPLAYDILDHFDFLRDA